MFFLLVETIYSISKAYILPGRNASQLPSGYINNDYAYIQQIEKEKNSTKIDERLHQYLTWAKANATSNYKNEFPAGPNVSMSQLAGNYNYIFVQSNLSTFVLDLTNCSNQIYQFNDQLSSGFNLSIKSNTTNLSTAIPILSFQKDVKPTFQGNVTYNTIEIQKEAYGQFTANNLISSNMKILNNTNFTATNKFYKPHNNTIVLGQNKTTVDNVTLPAGVNLIISPYVFENQTIVLKIEDNVTQLPPFSLYFDETFYMLANYKFEDYFNTFFYATNNKERNASLIIEPQGNWTIGTNKTVQVNISLYATKENQKFIDLEKLPKNLRPSFKTSPLFNISVIPTTPVTPTSSTSPNSPTTTPTSATSTESVTSTKSATSTKSVTRTATTSVSTPSNGLKLKSLMSGLVMLFLMSFLIF
ncbi:hypothetical protein GPJ56_001661 [Histomonas meleagridis]|uniref:uncharacterized protein n=1 Tax=Histomonas meleagridis TaxID=135588 RepID=UPI003559BC76|nr:hypothetical protein GPJ56_001661 [Histomonas meleagridis]KAH0796253.1 hypothetical protein GO595_010146 [Histomonas meleagridis]